MSQGTRRAGGLEAGQRRIVLAVAVSAVMLLTLDASFNFVLNDIARDLNATSFQTSLLRQVPSVAALLVIFLAGTLGVRLGERRVMTACAALYTVGSLMVAISPVIATVTLGVLLADIGRSVLVVVGLALISSEVTDKDGRATAFAAFTAALPITFLLMPLIAGLLVEYASWRWVAVVWALSGVVGLVALLRLLPPGRPVSRAAGEMVTPALAGLVLVAIVQVITVLPSQGLTTRVWLTIAIGTVATVALAVALRRLRRPTFSLAPLRGGGLVLLLVVVALALFATALIELDTPIWVSVLTLSVYSAAAVGASVTLTNAVMDLAPKGQDGIFSSYRGAALNLGSAIGVAGMTSIVFLPLPGFCNSRPLRRVSIRIRPPK